MFKKFFRIGSTLKSPIEPIFPKEKYSIFKLTINNSLALATINTGYNNYLNKIFYPWYVEIIIDINDKNENGHPTNEESEILNRLEEKITDFLKQTQTIHPIGRFTRNGERDIFYYIDKPKLDKKKTKEFFDSINAIRPMNFTLKEDKKWSHVGAFIK